MSIGVTAMQQESHFGEILGYTKTIVEMTAWAVGAMWGYLKTFKPKLDASISGDVWIENKSAYLAISARVSNIGLRSFKLLQEGTAVQIFSYVPKQIQSGCEVVAWTRLETLSVFTKHTFLAPGETVGDEILVGVRDVGQAFKIDLRVVSKGIEWNTSTTVKPTKEHQ